MVAVRGKAVRSSRGPEAVPMWDLEMPRGGAVGRGGLGEGMCHWRVEGPKGIADGLNSFTEAGVIVVKVLTGR